MFKLSEEEEFRVGDKVEFIDRDENIGIENIGKIIYQQNEVRYLVEWEKELLSKMSPEIIRGWKLEVARANLRKVNWDLVFPIFNNEIQKIEDVYFKLSKKYEYCSTQVNLPRPLATAIRKFSREKIDKEDLNEDGLEKTPHVTIFYGLKNKDLLLVKQLIRRHKGPIKLKLGKISCFRKEDFDVVKIDVESKDLKEIYDKLKPHGKEPSFSSYKPHITIAYLKPGEGKKYAGDTTFEGIELEFDHIIFSDHGGKKRRINLGTIEKTASEEFNKGDRVEIIKAPTNLDWMIGRKGTVVKISLDSMHEVTIRLDEERADKFKKYITEPYIYIARLDELQKIENYFKLSTQFTWPREDLYIEELTYDDFPACRDYLLKVAKLPDAQIRSRYCIHPKYDGGVIWLDSAIRRNLGQEYAEAVCFHESWHALGYDDDDPETGATQATNKFVEEMDYPVNTLHEVTQFIDECNFVIGNVSASARSDFYISKVFKVADNLNIKLHLIGSYTRTLWVTQKYNLSAATDIDFVITEGDPEIFLPEIVKSFEGSSLSGPYTHDSYGQQAEYWNVHLHDKDAPEVLQFSVLLGTTGQDLPGAWLIQYTIDSLELDQKCNVVDRYGGVSDLLHGRVLIRPTSQLMNTIKPYLDLDKSPWPNTSKKEESKEQFRLRYIVRKGRSYLHYIDNAYPTEELEQLFDLYAVLAQNLEDQLDGMSLNLYHGTSTVCLPGILKDGLSTSQKLGMSEGRKGRLNCAFLTSGYAWAASAAKHTARKLGGEPVILTFKIDLKAPLETKLLTGMKTVYELVDEYGYSNEFGSFDDTNTSTRYSHRYNACNTIDEILERLLPIHTLQTINGEVFPLDEFCIPNGVTTNNLVSIELLTKDKWNSIATNVHPYSANGKARKITTGRF